MFQKQINKIRRALGFDVREVRTLEKPVYNYKLEKEVSTQIEEGHLHHWENGEFVISKLDNETWSLATIYPFSKEKTPMKPLLSGKGFEEVVRVRGVTNWEREKVREDKWEVTVNKAEATIENVETTSTLV